MLPIPTLLFDPRPTITQLMKDEAIEAFNGYFETFAEKHNNGKPKIIPFGIFLSIQIKGTDVAACVMAQTEDYKTTVAVAVYQDPKTQEEQVFFSLHSSEAIIDPNDN